MKTKHHLTMIAGILGLILLWYGGTAIEDILQGHELLSRRAFTYFDWGLYALVFLGLIRIHFWYYTCPQCSGKLEKHPMHCPGCGLWKTN